jgi:hypothetical protein
MQLAIRKAQPDYSAVHLDTLLTTISVAYLQDTNEFVADRIFPTVPVARKSDVFKVYRKEDFMRASARKRIGAVESAGGGFEFDANKQYNCDVWSFHVDIDDYTRANADPPIDVERDATELITRVLLLTREKVWVDTAFTNGVWANEYTGVASGPGADQFLRWDNANSDPLGDVKRARLAIKATTGFLPNTLVLDERVYEALFEHPQIVERIKYVQRALPGDLDDRALLARAFRVQNVYVLGAVMATGPENAATISYLSGKHAWLGYVAPRPGLLQPSAGYVFTWRLPGVPEGGRVAIERFRMPHLRADRLEANMAFDVKVVSADLGAFFQGAIS